MSLLKTFMLLLLFASPVCADYRVWEDTTGNATAQFVIDGQEALFSARKDPFIGFSDSAWWVEVTLNNASPHRKALTIVLPYFPLQPLLAYSQDNGVLSKQQLGANIPIAERSTETHQAMFAYELEAGQVRKIYIRQVSSSTPIRINYRVINSREYATQLAWSTTVLVSAVTILASLCLLNAFYFVTSRRPVFGYYALYLALSGGVAIARLGGIAYLQPVVNVPINFTEIAGAGSYVFFALTLNALYRDLHSNVIRYVTFFCNLPLSLIMLVATLIDPSVGLQLFSKLGLGVVLLLGITTVIIAGQKFGYSSAKYISLGWIGWLCASILAVLHFRGLLGPQFNGVLIVGVMFQGVIFTFVLANKLQSDLQAQKREIEQAYALERITQLARLGELAASISHELKQPLAAIKLMTENLLRAASIHPTKALEMLPTKLGQVISLVDRATDLADHVRKSSRMSANEVLASDIHIAIDGCRLILDPQLMKRGIELRLSLAENLPTVAVYPLRLDQILLNIIGNATDVIDVVNPENKWISVVVVANNDRVTLTIEDSAGGISKDVMNRVFDQFFTTKEADKGTGLGLSICKNIVDEVGGDISVCNTENGAMFTIQLPIANPQAGDL